MTDSANELIGTLRALGDALRRFERHASDPPVAQSRAAYTAETNRLVLEIATAVSAACAVWDAEIVRSLLVYAGLDRDLVRDVIDVAARLEDVQRAVVTRIVEED